MSAGGFDLGKFFDGPYPLDYLSCAQREIPNKPTSLYGSTAQTGIISLFHAGQENALENWEKQASTSHYLVTLYFKKMSPGLDHDPSYCSLDS